MTLAADFRDAARLDDGWACVHQGAWDRLLARVEAHEKYVEWMAAEGYAKLDRLKAKEVLRGAS